ncbi:trifunctional serine/threonine-protein kinase/ATP-binding protein/sensor histidine kinase [Leptothoe kymatousa]|uniref:histidine kinase n=1 Tax=Leptothoe kymatousa TAU-MAC 1615 TaxID=2364775 RepID=A0ABS5XZ36_9CYAN|nr:AAA family ATPase [Leptothoe kymatousa]MBT9310651.1 AAA family ATPase [Leptothoe kymatousa TAU-MAC 1615]
MLTLSGYSSLKPIYESARTRIFRARQDSSQRPVILKTSQQAYPSPLELARYHREYALLSKVKHAGVIQTYGLEPHQNGLVLVLEDCAGVSLKQWRQTQALSLADILTIGLQVTEQLLTLHNHHIVHKDINPANILVLPPSQRIKLIDFGMATEFAREVTTAENNVKALEGTLAYLAPEQTGRTNHSIDHRSDFYGLGVTLYELLTGQVPFVSNDLLELVHCHIAKTPPPISQLNRDVPTVVSDLVMKLMAKSPDARYQSAWGLKQDLHTCLEQWKQTKHIEPFTLATQDIPQQFVLSQTLYGRETAMANLEKSFQQSCQGPTQVALIAGSSGSGKSALVNGLKPFLYNQRATFFAGKFEQFQQSPLPYAALTSALSHWVDQVLTLPEDQFQQWCDRIRIAVGVNGQLLIDLIPALRTLIGDQPPVPELPPTESQKRFEWVFLSFMQVLCTPEQPLVLFLDDLQWADRGTLQLIELMVREESLQHLFLIGAYRHTELDTPHPLHGLLQYLEKAERSQKILLPPLDVDQVGQLISDSFRCDDAAAQSLAKLIHQKTSGYPFFVNQLLRTLHQDQLITLGTASMGSGSEVLQWRWDLDQIRTYNSTENVAQLVLQSLGQLSELTQTILSWAACWGTQFELATLARLMAQANAPTLAPIQSLSLTDAQVELYRHLLPAIQNNLIVPTASFVLPTSEECLVPQPTANVVIPAFKFIHDQVQQTALERLSDQQTQEIHLHIGRYLSQQDRAAEHRPSNNSSPELSTFRQVDYLNQGQPLITDGDEKQHLAQLNLAAGKKAMATTAYASASSYFNMGLQNLPAQPWQAQPQLTFDLTYSLAEAQQRQGQFEPSEALIKTMLAQLTSPLDQAQVIHLLILQYTLQARYEEAIAIGRQALDLLGFSVPTTNLEPVVEQQLTDFKAQLGDRPVASLLNNSPIESPTIRAAVKILGTLQPTAYRTNPQLFMWVVSTIITLAIHHGDAPEVCYAYGAYGILLSGLWGEYARGHEFGQMSLELSRKLNNPMQECKACMVLGSFLNHWLYPLHTTEAIYHDGYYAGLASGELQYVGYSLSYQGYHFFYQGQPLANILTELPNYLALTQKHQNQWATDALWGCERILRNLMGETASADSFDLDTGSEKEYLTRTIGHQSHNPLARYYILKAYVLYLYGDYAQALTCVEQAQALLDYVVGTVAIPEYTFISALTLAALFPHAAPETQTAYWAQITQHQQQLQDWASHCAANFEHKALLVAAEIERLQDRPWPAMELYEQAIASAHGYRCLPNEALARERAADLLHSRQQLENAQFFRQKAHQLYQRWGAQSKVALMAKQYPQLITPQLGLPPLTSLGQGQSISVRSDYSDHILDRETVIKASQALSSEILLPNLLSKLLALALENAGGQSGVLLLNRTDRLTVEVTHGHFPDPQVDQSLLATTVATDYPYLPQSLVQYVVRTQRPMVLDNAQESQQFSQDRYIQTHGPKSIVCAPILRQAELVGLIYLENNLMAQAFTHQHVEMLSILSAQAAISIQNSILFDNLSQARQTLATANQELEQKVRDRTQALAEKNTRLSDTLDQLKQTQIQLIQTEKMSSLGQMVAGIAHEINNPVSFIYGNLEPAQEYTDDLLSLIEQYQHHYPDPAADITALAQKIDITYIKEDLPSLLNSMTVGAERIADIITSLRNFSRLDEAEQKPVDIHEGLDSTLLILQNRLKENSDFDAIDIQKDYGPLPPISCYASQLNQVFMNILSNAIDALREAQTKALDSFTPHIHIQTRRLATHYEIQISDNGPGIPEALREKIFDPFFTTKSVGKGTGLGLSIAYQIVTQQHDGTLTCESSTAGTTLTITLPMPKPEGHQTTDSAQT